MSTDKDQLLLTVNEYNYEHFTATQLFKDVRLTLRKWGVPPGKKAPSFELPNVEGGLLRLDELKGKPVVLRFTSYT